MRQLLQGKAKTARAVSPKNNKETVTSVRTELETIKSLAPDLKESDDVSPDGPPPLLVMRPAPGRPRLLVSLLSLT